MSNKKIIWTPDAERDIDEIYSFYMDKSGTAADKIYHDILDKVELLRDNPDIAPKEQYLTGYPVVFRSLVVFKGNYKIIYVVIDNTVYITHIWDCRQNPERMTRVKRVK